MRSRPLCIPRELPLLLTMHTRQPTGRCRFPPCTPTHPLVHSWQATKNLEKAQKAWEGEPDELAQVGAAGAACRAGRADGRRRLSTPSARPPAPPPHWPRVDTRAQPRHTATFSGMTLFCPSLCLPSPLLAPGAQRPGLCACFNTPLSVPPLPRCQVHNALGYAYFNMEKTEAAVAEYKKAVQLQPGYVTGEPLLSGCIAARWGGGPRAACSAGPGRGQGSLSRAVCKVALLLRRRHRCCCFQRVAPPSHPLPSTPGLPLFCAFAAWNNLGDAYERKKAYSDALAAYTEALTYAPDNKVAQARGEYCRTRLQRAA